MKSQDNSQELQLPWDPNVASQAALAHKIGESTVFDLEEYLAFLDDILPSMMPQNSQFCTMVDRVFEL